MLDAILGADAAKDCGQKGTVKTENGSRKTVGWVGFGGGMMIHSYGVLTMIALVTAVRTQMLLVFCATSKR